MIDTMAESIRLEAAYERILDSLGRDASRISEGLVSRIGLRPSTEPRWTQQFSELTTFYPLLQSEGMAGVEFGIVRKATVAHLCVLVHAFIEDRHLDGQICATREELSFSKSLLLEGWATLHDFPGIDRGYALVAKDLMTSYRSSVTSPPERTAGDSLEDEYVTSVSTGRAAYGALAPLALAHCTESNRGYFEGVRDAYEAVVTALQWADDCEDWVADFEANERNFLLETLALRGFDAYAVPRGRVSRASVGSALVELEVFAHALEEANRWVDEAVRRQEALGCYQLAEIIKLNFRPLETAEERLGETLHSA